MYKLPKNYLVETSNDAQSKEVIKYILSKYKDHVRCGPDFMYGEKNEASYSIQRKDCEPGNGITYLTFPLWDQLTK